MVKWVWYYDTDKVNDEISYTLLFWNLISGILTGRFGVWCDSPSYPMNTVCVREMPPDFCPSVRPQTTFLSSRWQPAFVRTDCVGKDPVTGKDREGVCTDPPSAMNPLKRGAEPSIVVDYGDACCLSQAMRPDALTTGAKGAALSSTTRNHYKISVYEIS